MFKSADVDKAVVGAMASKFRNCGQACISANRFLIQDEVYDEFLSKLTAATKALVIGDGKETNVQLGPLVNEAQFNKVGGLVEDARAKGATIVTGGRALPAHGKLYYEPTIITGITKDMRLYTEEVFGPVVSIFRFSTEEEGLSIANDSQRGLAGYFFSQDLNQVFRVAKRMEVGMVGINDGAISAAEAAFGGVKESGIGREGGKHGIDDYIQLKYMCLGGLSY